MKTKHIIIAGIVVGVAGLAYAGYRKIQKLKAVFSAMNVYPSGLRNVKIGLSHFTFNLDLTIENPTKEDFSIDAGSFASVKRAIAYRNGHFLGMATLAINMVHIPALNTLELKNIPFEVSPENVLKNVITIESFSLEQLSFVVVVEILGKEYYIES